VKAQLTIDVEYNPSVTDPEALATAMDRLLETACSTPGILDEYGDPTLGEFLVARAGLCSPPTVVLNVSGGLVQDVFCAPHGTRVVLVDWDTEGRDAASQGVFLVETEPGHGHYVFAAEIPTTPLDQLAGTDIDRALLAAGIDVDADPAIVVPDKTIGTWKCDECGWTVAVSYAQLAEIGTPLCRECDIEMSLLSSPEEEQEPGSRAAGNGPVALDESYLVAMIERVAETADNWADCSDMKEALAVFKELGQDCRALLKQVRERPEEPHRYILYHLDTDSLLSTTIYHDYAEAVEDADQVDDVVVVPFPFDRSSAS